MSTPDAVVVGAGPNGLVAANLLAERGWHVVVLEAKATPGGSVRSTELIEPGYVNDVCSAFYPLGAASPVLARLGLEQYGLRWLHAPLVVAHPALDGSCPVLSRDLDTTAASLDACHPGDGDAWRALYARWTRIERAILATLFAPFPPIAGTARLATRIRPRDYTEFIRFLLLPVRRLGEEHFGGGAARRLVAASALHADLAPEAALSGFFGWLLTSLGQRVGFPVPAGGASGLTDALVRRLEHFGGEVLCNEPVERVVVRRGRAVAVRTRDGTEIGATRAVLAAVSAPALYRRMLCADDLPAGFRSRLQQFQWDNGTVKVDWTLDGPIPWTADAARRAGTVHLVESVDALTRIAAETVCGDITDDPFLIVGQQSMTDPSRQPAGKETAWAYTHVPHPDRAPASKDPTVIARLVERMEATVEAHAPGFRQLVRGRHVLTPSSFETENPSLEGGALNGGTAQLHQQLVFRPFPGLGRPETPVASLFLASAAAHPGGGVHGGPGANAARAAVLHDRLAHIGRRT
ncbi:MAG TPA: NAD(P)/FAD-dependent oxidoreductase [Acidimicrobiia bacterium]|nr:NAD(P)/FAD-dependent oxidoreductase [Acidimicrobiia bacterium]